MMMSLLLIHLTHQELVVYNSVHKVLLLPMLRMSMSRQTQDRPSNRWEKVKGGCRSSKPRQKSKDKLRQMQRPRLMKTSKGQNLRRQRGKLVRPRQKLMHWLQLRRKPPLRQRLQLLPLQHPWCWWGDVHKATSWSVRAHPIAVGPATPETSRVDVSMVLQISGNR